MTTQIIAESAMKAISEIVRQESAIVIDEGKDYLVETRLRPLLRRLGIESFDELAKQARAANGTEVKRAVVEALTTNETHFFRDEKFYEALREGIFPQLVEQLADRRVLKMWCAACSSGQEPYSVLMLLAEHFPQVVRDWKLQFIVSDLSRAMQDRTREGVYAQHEVNRGLPARLLVKYCERDGTHWRIKSELRDKLDVREINLVRPWCGLPRDVDIVFMRNVLIYFDLDTKKEILQRVKGVLAPHGTLFLGAAETTLNLDREFVRHPQQRTGCYLLG